MTEPNPNISYFEASQARNFEYEKFLEKIRLEDETNFRKGLNDKETEVVKSLLSGISDNTEPEEDDDVRRNFRGIRTLASNPELYELVKSNMVDGDQTELRKKTNRQVETLKKLYDEQREPERGQDVEDEKLASFVQHVDSFIPFRKDKDINKSKTHESFQSPRMLGIERGDHGYDFIPQSGAYVYGSFDKLSHDMAGQNLDSPKSNEELKDDGMYILDESDIEDRAEIVMIDIADVKPRQDGEEAVEMYLNSLFDYGGGKKILAYYLALIFTDVKECAHITRQWGSRFVAEKWNRHEDDFVNSHKNDDPDLPEQRIREIYRKIQEIYKETSIMPPVQLEVRVRDSAKIRQD